MLLRYTLEFFQHGPPIYLAPIHEMKIYPTNVIRLVFAQLIQYSHNDHSRPKTV